MIKLNPDERLLLEFRPNHYKLAGPGLIWLKPWERMLTKLYIGPQGQPLAYKAVRTRENVILDVTAQILYQIEPPFFSEALLPKLPVLNDGGWLSILKWRTEHILRQLWANYTWRDLSQPAVQGRVERQLTQTLAGYMKGVGLKITSVCFVRIELPGNLQQTIMQAEQDSLEPRGRAAVLKEYFDIFGSNLAQAMPYIVQWELLNTIHKNGQPHLLLTSSALGLNGHDLATPPHVYQMQLPLPEQSRG